MAYRIHSSYETQSADDDGQRACARGEHCAGRKTIIEDGEIVVVPAPTYQAYCLACRSRIANCLSDFPKRYAELEERIGDIGSGTSIGLRVSGGGVAPGQPYNLGVDAFQRYIVEVLASWEERVRIVDGLSDIDGPRRGHVVVDHASRILTPRVDALLALPKHPMARSKDLAAVGELAEGVTGVVHPNAGWVLLNDDFDGVYAGTEILRLHYRCLARLGWTPQHHDLYTDCWDCELPRLRRWDGTVGLADHVVCRNCRSEYLADRLARLMVEEENTIRRRAIKQMPANGPIRAA